MRLITKLRIALSILATPFLVVLYLNIEKWAEKYGYDMILTKAAEGEMPDAFMQFALSPLAQFLAVAILGLVAGIWIDASLRKLTEKVTVIRPNVPTSLQIQFQAGSQNAVQLGNENIENSHFERQAFNFYDENGQLIDQRILWLGILIFKKPTHYGQIVVDAGQATIPNWTVLSQKHSMAIVRFEGDIGNVALTIKTIPPNQA